MLTLSLSSTSSRSFSWLWKLKYLVYLISFCLWDHTEGGGATAKGAGISYKREFKTNVFKSCFGDCWFRDTACWQFGSRQHHLCVPAEYRRCFCWQYTEHAWERTRLCIYTINQRIWSALRGWFPNRQNHVRFVRISFWNYQKVELRFTFWCPSFST